MRSARFTGTSDKRGNVKKKKEKLSEPELKSEVAVETESVEEYVDKRPKWLRTLTKGLLFFHVCAVISWTLPEPSAQVVAKKVPPQLMDYPMIINQEFVKFSFFQTYVLGLGFWQSWDMFSPNPSNRDVWGSAIIEYQDGSERHVNYPRVKTYGYLEKYEKERFRKYWERVNLDRWSYLREPVCMWMARTHWTDPNNPPVKVRLYMHLKEVKRIPSFPSYVSKVVSEARAGRLSIEVVSPRNPIDNGPYPTTLIYEHMVEKSKL